MQLVGSVAGSVGPRVVGFQKDFMRFPLEPYEIQHGQV